MQATQVVRNRSESLAVIVDESNSLSIWGNDQSELDALIEDLASDLQFDTSYRGVIYAERALRTTRGVEGTHSRMVNGMAHSCRIAIDLYPSNGEGGDVVGFVTESATIPESLLSHCEKAFPDACQAGLHKGFPIMEIGIRLTHASCDGG